MTTNILSFSTALTETVLSLSSRSARQAAIVAAMGTAVQNVAVRNAAGSAKLTGTFAGTAYGATGPFLPTTALSSVAGDGGTAGSDWTLRVTNGAGTWWQGRFGSGNVWSYTIDNVPAAIDSSATTTRIRCDLAADTTATTSVTASTASTDWLNNNIITSTGSTALQSGEAEVLFSGSRTLKQNFFWVTPFNYPWLTDTQPPDNGLYGGVQWHGGWFINSSSTSAMWRPADATAFGATRAWHRGTLGTMLQFMLKNFSKSSGWTDADYDFIDSDIWIDTYGAAGKKVSFHWFCNITGSPIASFNGPSVPSISVARFKDALQRVAQRVTPVGGYAYKDVIGLWEGPNEPDSVRTGSGWNWFNQVGTMTAAQLASQYRIAAQCLKAVAPSALIMGPSFSAIDPHTSQAMQQFLSSSAQGSNDAGYGDGAGTTGADWVDVLAQHGYFSYDQADTAGVAAAYRDLKSKIQSGGGGGKPFMISEWMAFSGAWPNLTESGGDTDFWYYHNHMLIALANDAQIFVHFSYKNQSTFGQPAYPATAARRAKRDAFVNWLTAQPITRIARLTNGRIRVTRQDGQTRTTYEY